MTNPRNSEPTSLDVMEQTNAAFMRLLDMRKTMDPQEWRTLAGGVLKRAAALAAQVRQEIIEADPNECCVYCDRPRFNHPDGGSHQFTSFATYMRGPK